MNISDRHGPLNKIHAVGFLVALAPPLPELLQFEQALLSAPCLACQVPAPGRSALCLEPPSLSLVFPQPLAQEHCRVSEANPGKPSSPKCAWLLSREQICENALKSRLPLQWHLSCAPGAMTLPHLPCLRADACQAGPTDAACAPLLLTRCVWMPSFLLLC